jgi:membrane-associated phospholipid phosphatase
MIFKARWQELVILSTILTPAALAQSQIRPASETAPPDLLPSTVLANRASSFHLTGAPDLFPESGTFDTATATQGNREGGFLRRAVKRGLQDQKEIWTAPFHRANVKWNALFLAGTATLVSFDEQILHALPNSAVSTSSDISNGLIAGTGATLGGIFLVGGLYGGDSHAKETGILGIEALANAFLVYVPLQVIAGRERPNQGSGEGNFFVHHSLNTSFPSGHSMFAFSMATVIAHEYPRWWVELLSYGAAGAITGARMTAKMHFPSDLLVGGALGYLIGTHIFHSHCQPGLGSDCHSRDKQGPARTWTISSDANSNQPRLGRSAW